MAIKREFYVDLDNIAVLTEDHLKISKKAFNKDTYPEYFDLDSMGLTYEGTILAESADINPIIKSGMKQKFRVGANKKYKEIKDSTCNKGWNLRAKQFFAVGELDKKGDLKFLTELFSGNTTHDILGKYTNLQNRIVHVFRKNTNFSEARLKNIGGLFNSMDDAYDGIDWVTVEEIVRFNVEQREIALPVNPRPKDKEKFVAESRELISYVASGKFDGEDVKINTLMNNLIESLTGQVDISSIKEEKQLIKILRAKDPQKYQDSNYAMWKGSSVMASKLLTSFSKAWASTGCSDKMRIDMVIHFSTPNPADPIKWIKDSFIKFHKVWYVLQKFLNEAYFANAIPTKRFEIEGFYQQSKALEVVSKGALPYEEVISYDDMFEYFKDDIEKEYGGNK